MNELDELTAQGRRLFTISDRVEADREFKRWDDDVGEWLAKCFPDSGLSAKWSSLGFSKLVWDNAVGSSQDEWKEFRELGRVRLNWLSELPEINRASGRSIKSDKAANAEDGSDTHKQNNLFDTTRPLHPPKTNFELPDKVTLAWLWEKVPAKFWGWFVGLLVASFLFGTTVGQLSWVRVLYSDKSVQVVSGSRIITTVKPRRVTISQGEINLSGPGFYLVDTEGGSPSGDLRRINGLEEGDQVILAAASSTRTVIVKKGLYLKMPADFYLNNQNDRIVLVSDGSNTCSEISRSSNE